MSFLSTALVHFWSSIAGPVIGITDVFLNREHCRVVFAVKSSNYVTTWYFKISQDVTWTSIRNV